MSAEEMLNFVSKIHITVHQQKNRTNMRSTDLELLAIPQTAKVAEDRQFEVRRARMYNGLPSAARSEKSRGAFQARLKSLFL